jgi:YndJ-like protein
MVGIGLALAVGAIVVVPLALASLEVGDMALTGQLLRAARLVALPAGVSLAVALALPTGPLATALTAPWLVLGLACTAAAIVREVGIGLPFRPDVRHAESAALIFFAAAPVFAVADRLGLQPLGIDQLIVRLTAIHFTYAGLLLPMFGAYAWRARPNRPMELAVGAMVVGTPITALGFLGYPSMNWIGALLVAGGGFGVGLGALWSSGRLAAPASRALMRVVGLSLLMAMPMAAIYATGDFMGSTVIDVPTMARVHGSLNALGFALPAVFAMSLETRRKPGFVSRAPRVRQG